MPGTRTWKPAANATLLRTISPVYAGRGGLLTAALQYVYQAVRAGSGNAELGRAFEELAGAKLRDFEEFGTFLVSLGADPVFTACPPYPVSYHSCAGVDYAKDPPAMIAADIRMETALSEELGRLASFAEGETETRLLGWKARAEENLVRLKAMLETVP